MKRFNKYICLFFLVLFSFYYTHKVSQIIINNTYLMKSIKSNSKDYEKPFINATINGKYITSGLNGLKVDYKKSYYNMKSDNIFSSSKIVFIETKPNISIYNHKDLLINKGSNKGSVAIVYENNKYLLNKKIKLTRISEINSSICFVIDEYNCSYNIFLVTYTHKINNYISIKDKINAGDIIYIEDNMKESDINLLLKEISFRDLKIDYLENVISESR